MRSNTEIEQVHISMIRAGDTILHDNKETTVTQGNIRKCSFMGITLFGDSYHLGHKLVKRLKFKRVLPR